MDVFVNSTREDFLLFFAFSLTRLASSSMIKLYPTHPMALGKVNSFKNLFPLFQSIPEWSELTEGQKTFARRFFETDNNHFLTGSAGVGKSFIINTLSHFLISRGVAMGKTASTGVAAFNIGGQTLHSWMGIGLGDEDTVSLIARVKKSKKAQERIKNVKVLLIDEASMIKGELLDKVDVILKYFRYSEQPWGGVKVILTGDLLQLLPVFKPGEIKTYAFESRAWREGKIQVTHLTEIVRQDNNGKFAALLNELRFGDTTNIGLLKERVGIKPPPGVQAVSLYCRNVDVDRINREKLAEIKAPSKFFDAKDTGMPHHIEQFNKNCPAAQRIELKKGAQVICLANINVYSGIVNGSVGTVTGFNNEGVEVKFKTGTAIIAENTWEIKEQEVTVSGSMKYRVVATRTQIPLKVAYALSVHRAQGQTLDCAYLDMNEAFASGQSYVALSRVRNLESLYLEDFCPSRVIVDPKCAAFYKELTS